MSGISTSVFIFVVICFVCFGIFEVLRLIDLENDLKDIDLSDDEDHKIL